VIYAPCKANSSSGYRFTAGIALIPRRQSLSQRPTVRQPKCSVLFFDWKLSICDMNFSVSLRLYLLSYERSSKCEFDEEPEMREFSDRYNSSTQNKQEISKNAHVRLNQESSLPYFPKTFFKRSVTLAAGSVRIFFSSCPIM